MENYKISPNLAISENGFLFLPSTGESFTLNPIAIEIIEGLKSGKSLTEISAEIIKEYEVDETTLERDLTDFISQLKNYNLLEEL